MSHHKQKEHNSSEDESAVPAPAAQESAPPEQPPQAETVESLRRERDDLLARLQRVSADYLNYQKRVQRDIAQAHEFANEDLVKSLLPVLDDMERALVHARENHPADDPLLVGMELVYAKALETLGRVGLTAIKAQGQAFDPENHSALLERPSDQYPPRTVLQELQTGYKLKGRTIRPTHVIVSKAPTQAEDQEQEMVDQ